MRFQDKEKSTYKDGLAAKPKQIAANKSLRLNLSKFKELVAYEIPVLDCRTSGFLQDYLVPSSTIVPFNKKDFSSVVQKVFPDKSKPLIIIATHLDELPVIEKLHSLFYHNILGFLDGGMDAWENAQEKVKPILKLNVIEANSMVQDGELKLLHFEGDKACNNADFNLNGFTRYISKLDPEKNYLIYSDDEDCAVLAYSLLMKKGFQHVFILDGKLDRLKLR